MSGQVPLEGLQQLRSGILFEIIATLLLVISLPLSFLTAGLGAAVVLIAAAVLGLVGILRVRSGFIMLRDSGLNVGTGATGATLVIVGYILIVIGAILILALIGLFFLPLGGLIYFIGIILLAIGFYNLGNTYNEGLVKWGGILSIVLGLIGYIMVYIGLGNIIRNLSSGGPTQPYSWSQAPGQVYQVGQGVLRADGYASFTLYSPYQATIVSGYIEGVGARASSITPSVLFPGQNNITAYFGNVNDLARGSNYVIVLTLNVQGSTMDVRVNVIYQ